VTAPTAIGFVGLGDMGAPMAERLLLAGADLQFFARRPEVADHFVELGGRSATTLRQLGAASDVVEIVVTGDAAVRDVVLGDNLLAGMRPGSVMAVHSTIHPDTCRELADVAERRGVDFIDAPVSGGRERARVGALTVMLGGATSACDRVAPLFAPFASLVRRMGPVGAGQVAKLLNNFFALAHEATARAELRLAAEVGLDMAAALEVLPTCSGSSERLKVLAATGGFVHPKGDAVRFTMFAEELALVRDLAARWGVDLGPTETIVVDYVEHAWAKARDA
jgi:3-hydroxyisobutyrate dehydrogenase-like beta-hydroxyacid dehydrogenase